MSIKLTKASSLQLNEIMTILTKCTDLLRSSGSPQWANNDGPTEEELVKAIENDIVYLLQINDVLVGTTILSPEIEPAYDTITYGEWQKTGTDYVSIHRFAIDPTFGGKGYATLFLKLLVILAQTNGARDIRIDTHPLNLAMQHVILANDFHFKGIVQLPIENGERYAYQRVTTH